MTPITEDKVKEILRLISFGIPKGLGEPVEGQMYIEHIIAHVFGEGVTDFPSCVGASIRAPKIVLNNCNWSSHATRAMDMAKIGIAQLGSSNLDQREFLDKLKLASTKRILPFIIQKHFESTKDEKLLVYKIRFENLIVLDNELWLEFYNNHNNDNYYYDNYYYDNYYYYNYYYHYYYYHYYYYYNYYYGDEFLLLIADVILSVLIDMNCEGCKYLHLVENFQPIIF